MSTSDALSWLIHKLEETGLADTPGKLLYSGVGTLSPDRLYVLGYNPGGDPDAESDSPRVHLAKLARMSPDWNEYVDGAWRPGGRVYAPGDAPMQKRVRHLLTGLGLTVPAVCASNVIFARSRVSSGLSNQAQLAERCWPVHQFILGHVRPAGILSIGGGSVFDFISSHGRLLSAPERFQAGHATWECLAARVQLGTQNMAIVSVPHLARYAIDRHPEVIRWVRTKLGL